MEELVDISSDSDDDRIPDNHLLEEELKVGPKDGWDERDLESRWSRC